MTPSASLRSSIFQLTVTSSTQSRRAMILEVCADERAALGFDPAVRFDGPVDTIISNKVGDHLLGVLREALSNVAHHAQATTVEVTVAAVPRTCSCGSRTTVLASPATPDIEAATA